jgi:4-hydroxy-2-oxoheptanedioate aldolase
MTPLRTFRLAESLQNGSLLFGPNLHFDCPSLVETMGIVGFDFVMLDAEHGVVWQRLPELVRAAEAADIAPLIRVPSHERGRLIQALELGPAGVVVPMVDTAEQAAALVAEAKFPPLGKRGFSNVSRAGRYGAVRAADYTAWANANTALILLLESAQAFANADAIAAVPGVDLLLIGPSDYAQSMGHSGDPGHPEVQRSIEAFVAQLSQRIPVGIASFRPDEPETVSRFAAFGAQLLLVSSVAPIRNCFAELNRRIRSQVPEGR